METVLTVTVVLASVALLFAAFIIGYRAGKLKGLQAGADLAVKDLLLAKNPELWDAAHFLAVDHVAKEDTALIRKEVNKK